VISNLIVPRSATTNYVLMLVPTLWVFSALDRHGRWGRLTIVFALLAMLVGQWWLQLATVVGNQEQPALYWPWPLALGLVLWAGGAWLQRETLAAHQWPAARIQAAVTTSPSGAA
jgi:hypothetical protein